MKTRTLHSGGRSLEVSTLCLGVMYLGVREDAGQSHAILDRYFEAGGRFFDTANNYGAWTEESLGTAAGDSERLLGGWIASRGVADEVVVATKSGAGKLDPAKPLAGGPPTNFEGLAADVVRRELTSSLERLGLDRVGVYYGHVDDRNRPATEIADTFAGLVEEELVTIPGLSNTAAWRLAEARQHSRDQGRPEFGVWQQEHSVYWPKPGDPDATRVTPEVLDYAASESGLTVVSYSPQQSGQLVRPWMEFREAYDHPGSVDRLRLVHRIAHEVGGTANQVALAWHLAGPASRLARAAGSDRATVDELPARRAAMIPVLGASSVAQLDESVEALDLTLSADQLVALDSA